LAHTTKLIAVEDDDARQVLKGLGFTCVTSNWYVPFEDISRQFQMRDRTWAAFHTVLRMLRFCGQLNLNEVHLGLSKHAERLKYDVPPVDVLHRILEMYGFTIDEGRVAWKHDNPSALSGGEELIFRELKSYGGIVGYFELVQAFENAGKSLPALSKTLAYSALFKKAAIGLYILRGTSVTELEIQKAKERQPQTVSNTEITFDLSGEVVFRLNLGSLTISTGVIYAPCLQYLSGTWYVELDGQVYGNLKISDHQLWGLGKVLRAMHLQVGDRVELRFDTWSRAVKLNRFRNGFIEAN
jgi:hypothetical protein